jgi:hypothetical protein
MTELKTGVRVRILKRLRDAASEGVIYRHMPGSIHPWHVRPDNYRKDEPGIAFAGSEIEAIEAEEQAVQVSWMEHLSH